MLFRINVSAASPEVRIGSLVRCSNGLFFIGIGLGKIQVATGAVFCVSTASPIGQALIGKKEGEQFSVNGRSFSILEVK